MKQHQINIDFGSISPVEIYQQILNGERKRFPNGFFSESDATEKAGLIFRYLIETILQWKPEDIKRNFNSRLMTKYKLSGLFLTVFNKSPLKALNAAYPGKFKEWELQHTYKDFWNNETGIRATKWLIEDKLKWTENDIKAKVTKHTFYNNGLSGMLHSLYHGSVWQAINAAYPNKFKEWELQFAPKKFWNQKTGIQATKWLIEEKLKWTEDDIKEKLTYKTFFDNGLRGMLCKLYNNSPWRAINAAYPNQYKEWEFQKSSNYLGIRKTPIQATRWLIEDKLKWTQDDIKGKISKEVFTNNGFGWMLESIYNDSVWQAINAAYPGRFQRKDLSREKA